MRNPVTDIRYKTAVLVDETQRLLHEVERIAQLAVDVTEDKPTYTLEQIEQAYRLSMGGYAPDISIYWQGFKHNLTRCVGGERK